jgi:hypothetical protein
LIGPGTWATRSKQNLPHLPSQGYLVTRHDKPLPICPHKATSSPEGIPPRQTFVHLPSQGYLVTRGNPATTGLRLDRAGRSGRLGRFRTTRSSPAGPTTKSSRAESLGPGHQKKEAHAARARLQVTTYLWPMLRRCEILPASSRTSDSSSYAPDKFSPLPLHSSLHPYPTQTHYCLLVFLFCRVARPRCALSHFAPRTSPVPSPIVVAFALLTPLMRHGHANSPLAASPSPAGLSSPQDSFPGPQARSSGLGRPGPAPARQNLPGISPGLALLPTRIRPARGSARLEPHGPPGPLLRTRTTPPFSPGHSR